MIITTIIGLVLGFFSNYLLAKYNSRSELIKSTIEKRANSYVELWELCDDKLSSHAKQKERYEAMKKWYSEGGGLFLKFEATDRFIECVSILKEANNYELSNNQLIKLKEHLSWLRTEMKYAVGSYSRREANKTLPSTIRKKKN